jgi:hypothetical protein
VRARLAPGRRGSLARVPGRRRQSRLLLRGVREARVRRRLTKRGTSALVLGAIACALMWTVTTAAHTSRNRHVLCGDELWSLKTLSDPLRNRVNLRPRATTIAAINRRRAPRVVPRRRTAFERQVWQLTAQITEYKLEADDDIHLILFGTGAYMNAELPAPVVSLAENA